MVRRRSGRRRRRGGLTIGFYDKPIGERNRIQENWRRMNLGHIDLIPKRKRSKRGQNLWKGLSKAFAKSQYKTNWGRRWAKAWGQDL